MAKKTSFFARHCNTDLNEKTHDESNSQDEPKDLDRGNYSSTKEKTVPPNTYFIAF